MAETLTIPRIAETMLERALETFESQEDMISLVSFKDYDPATMQNASNVVWKKIDQHAPDISGWDLTGSETGIIQEEVPCILGTPSNDFVEQRVDDLRDMSYWKERGEKAGRKRASVLNSALATAVKTQGSLFFRSSATSGYSFIAEAQALMNERQLYKSERTFLLNDRDNLTYGADLAARQTLQGRPAETWVTGQIGKNVAQFDVFVGSFLPTLVGGANPNVQISGDVSEEPEGGSVNTSTGVVTNVDWRTATINVTASANYNIGDKVYFANPNPSTPVYALGLDDKTNTYQPMTFTIIAKPTGTSVKVYPKPIAADDASLSTLQAAYANIDTQILAGSRMKRLNIDASAKTNLYWDKSAIQIIGGSIPAELFKQFDGMKVISETMKNGLKMYMVYDGSIATMTLRYRLFVWYGITVLNPSNCGVAVKYTGSAPTTLAPTTLATTLATTVIS